MSTCNCGYQDDHGILYTDATLVYFNETHAASSMLDNLVVREFLNQYEDGYGTTYRQAAQSKNVNLTSDALEMLCDVPNSQRIVYGAEVSTKRQDIQYGSFRAGIVPPLSDQGGTAMTMEYAYNISQKISLDVLNQNSANSVGLPGKSLSPYKSNLSENPFTFFPNEYRFDWSEDEVAFSASLNASAVWSIKKSKDFGMPSIPGSITFRHWSDGDPQHAQGPPKYNTEAGRLTYIRLFYNGTSTSDAFLQRCQETPGDICSTEDVLLRQSTPFLSEATIPWRYVEPAYHANVAGKWLVISSSCLFMVVFVHAICGRIFRAFKARRAGKAPDPPAYVYRMDKSQGNIERWSVLKTEDDAVSAATNSDYKVNITHDSQHAQPHEKGLARISSSHFLSYNNVLPDMYEIARPNSSRYTASSSTLHLSAPEGAQRVPVFQSSTKITTREFTAQERPSIIQVSRPRMDYLDGFRGVVCILVSLIHFCLTFYIGAINPSVPVHYSYETWFRRICSPIILNASIVLGCFFVLSARLIGVRYLRNRNLEELAGSTFRRIPRLFIPVAMAVTFEYFLISVGGVKWLRYMASVTWSTWPYTEAFPNAGYFFNELMALLFIIPNALPRIIYNYCTGVLWTIPVNIQYSWLCFLGVVVIKESKSPWKRLTYYVICIAANWYALNWGAYFWVGLAIGDLDSTYMYRGWFQGYWRKTALMITLWSCIFAFMTFQYLQQVNIFIFPTLEYGIHPDIYTGLPIKDTALAGFPPWNYPQVYALFIGSALLVLFDNSTVLQKVFSANWLRILGHHSYSVYLLHGAVFWSWGSWLTIRLHVAGLPYWAVTLIVFITSYTILFCACYVWTPVADVYAMIVSTSLWRYVQGKSLYRTIE